MSPCPQALLLYMCDFHSEIFFGKIRIPSLGTDLLSLPFNKLPCPQNVDCMTLGYSLGNLSMSGTSTSITPRCFFFSVLQTAKPWNTFHGFRTKIWRGIICPLGWNRFNWSVKKWGEGGNAPTHNPRSGISGNKFYSFCTKIWGASGILVGIISSLG